MIFPGNIYNTRHMPPSRSHFSFSLCTMPPATNKGKKRKHAEVHGPDLSTARRAPGFELETENTGTQFEQHTDYFKSADGLAGSSSMVQGPFSPEKMSRTEPVALADSPSPPSDTSLPAVNTDEFNNEGNFESIANVSEKRSGLLEGIWDCDESDLDSDVDDMTMALPQAAGSKKKRKRTQAVGLSQMRL